MKKLTIVLLLLTAITQAQVINVNNNLKTLNIYIEQEVKQSNWNYYVGYSLIAVAAFAESYNHIQEHRYPQLLEKHPGLNQNFWGPNQWYNKWELDELGQPIIGQEKYPGSSSVFVTFTDAEHLTGFTRDFGYITGATIIQIGDHKNKKFWVYAAEIAGIVLLRSLIFEGVDHYYRGY